MSYLTQTRSWQRTSYTLFEVPASRSAGFDDLTSAIVISAGSNPQRRVKLLTFMSNGFCYLYHI